MFFLFPVSQIYNHHAFYSPMSNDSTLSISFISTEGLNTQLQLMGCVARLSAMQHKTRNVEGKKAY